MNRAIQLLGALVLVPIAIGNLIGGFAAADYYSERKLYGFLEGDWFFLFGLIGAAACLAIALKTARRVFAKGDVSPPRSQPDGTDRRRN